MLFINFSLLFSMKKRMNQCLCRKFFFTFLSEFIFYFFSFFYTFKILLFFEDKLTLSLVHNNSTILLYNLNFELLTQIGIICLSNHPQTQSNPQGKHIFPYSPSTVWTKSESLLYTNKQLTQHSQLATHP